MATNILVPNRLEDLFNPDGSLSLVFVEWMELVSGQVNVTSTTTEDTIIDVSENTTQIALNKAAIGVNGVNIATNVTDIATNVTDIATNATDISFLNTLQFEVVNTTVSTTTDPYQYIICRNIGSINITLNPTPSVNEEVHIKRRGDEVIVIGTIDGLTNKTINVNNYSMHLVFDGVDWSQI